MPRSTMKGRAAATAFVFASVGAVVLGGCSTNSSLTSQQADPAVGSDSTVCNSTDARIANFNLTNQTGYDLSLDYQNKYQASFQLASQPIPAGGSSLLTVCFDLSNDNQTDDALDIQLVSPQGQPVNLYSTQMANGTSNVGLWVAYGTPVNKSAPPTAQATGDTTYGSSPTTEVALNPGS